MTRRIVMRLLLLAMVLVLPGAAGAQQARTVAGRVLMKETGEPMAGVQIIVRGTSVGTLTDARGEFTLRVPPAATSIVLTHIGYRTQELRLRGTPGPLVIEMEQTAIGLEGIVVTALGVQREKRSLGYSVQDVSGEQLTEVPKTNIVDALHGRVAGVQITNATAPGGSSRIVIRGASSLTGNNQPLFIVDGVPIDNRAVSNNNSSNATGGGYDYGNRAGDIDPNNIESISVLKGANAAALYGSRAANGAVVITTKKGHTGGGLGITATTGVTFENALRLPSYQNVYGQGSGGEFQWVDGNYGGINDGTDESWGPRMECQAVDQFVGESAPFCPQPDNVRNFFNTGASVYTNVALARSDERSNVRLSLTRTQSDGMYPSNKLERWSAALTGGLDITERMRAEASVNYMKNEGTNRPGTGYTGFNPFQQFVWFGRQVDVTQLRNYRCGQNDTRRACTTGQQIYNWNYSYHDNPYFIAHENGNSDATDRVIGHASASYDFTDWLSVQVKSGTDWYREGRKRTYGYYSVENPKGQFGEDLLFNRETNTEFLATVTRNLMPDLTLTLNAGGNRRDQTFQLNNVNVSELVVPGVFTLQNAATTPISRDLLEKRRVNSLYGAANFQYRDYLSLDVTGRNDWSSTLPEDNNSYFYPSISAALVFTDALNMQSDLLSSGKIRASWTRVGNDADPYQTSAVFDKENPIGDVPRFTVPNELPNVALKPEEKTAWEVGADLGFLNERLGFVLTYYDESTVNQIMPVQISASSGFTRQVLNAGEVRNQGVELLLNATPLRLNDGLRWDMTVNWARNKSKVVDLYGDLQTLVLGTYWGLNIEARKGEPYGVMFGTPFLREDLDGDGKGDPNGRVVVHATGGYPLADNANRRVLGNYQPDWTGGLLNRVSYKNLDLSVLFDMQHGGNVFSVTNMFGRYSGVLEETLEGREIGPCEPGIIVPNSVYISGTDANDKPIYTANTDKKVCPELYNHALYGRHEPHIFDASYVKLREVRLGLRLPSSWTQRIGLTSADVALVGRNLALWTDVPNIDPETAFSASNVQGLEYGQFPTARSLGFTVTVRP
jgi:TonB-linked SusC/RagA family outer membrane protein